MAELVAKIGADASQLVQETRKATGAFESLKTEIVKDTKQARDAYGRFVADTSKGAASAAQAIEKIGDAFSDVRKSIKSGDVKGVLSGVAKGATAAARSLSQISGQVSPFSLIQQGASAALGGITALAKGVAVLGAALTGIGVKAAAEFGRFEAAFNQVRTLVDESQVDVASLDKGVRDLAQRYGVNLLEATNAAYQAISAGVDPAKVVEFLGTAFQGAAAGAATAQEVTDLLTSALNAYQKPASEAAKVSDVFFATIRAGKTTASELAESIGQVAPVASAANVSLEELGAALATLTASGLSTAEASTQVKALLIELQKPAANTAKLLEQVGVSAATIREEGLAATLTKVRDGAKALGVEFTSLFSNTRAIQGATTLAGSNYEKFLTTLKQTNGAAGEAAAAFDKTSKQLALSFGRLRAGVQNAFVQLGRALAPALQPALEAVASFVQQATTDFDTLAEAARTRYAGTFTELFKGISGESAGASTVVTSAVRAIGNAFRSVASTVSQVAGVFGFVAAAIKGVGEVALISGNVVRTVLGAALFSLVRPIAFILQGMGRLADLIPGVGSGLADAGDTLAEFANTLGGEALDSVQNVGRGLRRISELGDFADEIEKGTKRAAGGLRDFGREAVALATATDDLRGKQEEGARATTKLATVNDSAAGAARGNAAAQIQLADGTKQAAAAASGAAGALTNLERANVASLASIQAATAALAQQVVQLERARAAGETQGTAAAELSKFAAAADLAAASSRRAAEGYGGLESSAQRAIDTTRLLADALRDSTARLGLGENLGDLPVEQVLARAEARAKSLGEVLTGETRAAFVSLRDSFEEGAISAEEFLRRTEGFTEPFTALRRSVLQATGVLKGPFKAAADQLVVKLDQGKVSTQQFSREIQGLVDSQQRAALGFSELFRSVEQASGSFQRLNDSARQAKAALADQLRNEVQQLRLDLETGETSLDDYLAALRRLGDESARYQSLSESQLVVVQQLRESNGALASQVLELSGTLSGNLATAFATYVEAFRQGQLDASELQAALARLAEENRRVADSAEDVAGASGRAARGLRDQTRAATDAARAGSTLNESLARNTRGLADFLQTAARGTPLESTLDGLDLAFNTGQISASEYEAQLNSLFSSLQRGSQDFVGAAASGRLFNEQQDKLIPKINELGRRLDTTGRSQLKVLIDGFAAGVTTAEEFRRALQALADGAQQAGRAVSGAGQNLGVFGSPGQVQLTNRASGGSQLLGFQGTATGSSNYTSALEEQVGTRLGLLPKALRQRAQRTPGGLLALAEQTGVGRFAAGGPVLTTGQATVEAGEYVLNQRGLSDLGRAVAKLANSGGANGFTQQISNTFNLNVGEGEAALDTRRLAMELGPQITRAGALAASRSPIT